MWRDRIPDSEALERTGILSIHAMPKQLKLCWSGHLVRMDDERLPKRHFYGNVATFSRRRVGRVWRYKDTLKTSMKHLKINPTNWEDLVLDRSIWRRALKTGAAIHEANCVIAVKAKRDVHKSQIPRPRNAKSQPLLTCPRSRRASQAQTRLIGHLPTDCNTPTAPPDAPRSPLPRVPHRQLALTSILNTHGHPPPLSQRPLRRLLFPPPLHLILTHRQTPSSPPPTPPVWTRSIPVVIAVATSPHPSAWSITCESIAQGLANQFPEYQHTHAASASTGHTAPAHSLTAWACQVMNAATRVEFPAASKHLKHPAHPLFLVQPTPHPS
ncbi:hypothetical protein SprV_0100302200 [Sparganum proliferum]